MIRNIVTKLKSALEPKYEDVYKTYNKRQLDVAELLNLSPEELCKDRVSEEYFRLTTEGDCRDVVRYTNCNTYSYFRK